MTSHAPCNDCGVDVRVCHYCKKRESHFSDYCEDCYRDFGYAHQNYFPDDPEVKPFFLCTGCKQHRQRMKIEVYRYSYWQKDRDQPLSPWNCYRSPCYRDRDPKQDPVERADEALSAFQHELEFSGDIAEAEKILKSFYEYPLPIEKPVRPGTVTKEELLAGQHVTGQQFFETVWLHRWDGLHKK